MWRECGSSNQLNSASSDRPNHQNDTRLGVPRHDSHDSHGFSARVSAPPRVRASDVPGRLLHPGGVREDDRRLQSGLEEIWSRGEMTCEFVWFCRLHLYDELYIHMYYSFNILIKKTFTRT